MHLYLIVTVLYIAGDFILYIERQVILKNKWLRSGKLNQVYGA